MKLHLGYEVEHMSKNIVLARLMGGLGNQMFQYAAARRLAKYTDSELYIDATMLKHFDTPRKYELSRFPLKAKLLKHVLTYSAQSSQAFIFPDWYNRIFETNIRGIWRISRIIAPFVAQKIKIYRELQSTFDQLVLKLPAPIMLIGYWQDERYFIDIEDEIRSGFSLKDMKIDGINRNWLQKIRQSNSVSVHVRRGDYISLPANSNLGICSLMYFHSAMALMRERVQSPQFFIFSDDLDWCRAHLSAEDVEFVDANSTNNAINDLKLMSACQHQVVSNSSFSWWAAWLARGRITIVPTPWFDSQPSARVFPKGWIRVGRDDGKLHDSSS